MGDAHDFGARSDTRVVPLTALEAFVERVLGTASVPPAAARRIGAFLVVCELLGGDHCVGALAFYLPAFAGGQLNPALRGRVLIDEPVVTLLEGDQGQGAIGTTGPWRPAWGASLGVRNIGAGIGVRLASRRA